MLRALWPALVERPAGERDIGGGGGEAQDQGRHDRHPGDVGQHVSPRRLFVPEQEQREAAQKPEGARFPTQSTSIRFAPNAASATTATETSSSRPSTTAASQAGTAP